jgi:hypothetical protein
MLEGARDQSYEWIKGPICFVADNAVVNDGGLMRTLLATPEALAQLCHPGASATMGSSDADSGRSLRLWPSFVLLPR